VSVGVTAKTKIKFWLTCDSKFAMGLRAVANGIYTVRKFGRTKHFVNLCATLMPIIGTKDRFWGNTVLQVRWNKKWLLLGRNSRSVGDCGEGRTGNCTTNAVAVRTEDTLSVLTISIAKHFEIYRNELFKKII